MSEDSKLYRLQVWKPIYKPRIYTLSRIDYSTDTTPTEIVSSSCRCPYVGLEDGGVAECDSTCALFCFTRESNQWTVTLNCSGRVLRGLEAVDEG
jgi:hypothetical protein